MRLLHTADWHLGHHLHGHDRSHEQGYFLDWLIELIREREIDGLLIAGDIFDTANPSAASWQQFYRFLARVYQEFPHLNLIAIAGNHDSPSKLDAPHELLKAFDLHLIGAITRDADGRLETDRLIVPLTDRQGEIRAWCAAVPYLRSADLRLDEVELPADSDRMVVGVQAIYQQTLAAIEARRRPDQPIIALGHAYLTRGELSLLSERKILGGNQHALPAELFNGADYVALGHLHLAQAITPHVHYSGSPIPLSMAEAGYHHQVLELEVGPAGVQVTERHGVPRRVAMLRCPQQPEPLDQVESQLQSLALPSCEPALRPFLEVHVHLDKPEPRLRERVLAALGDKPVRLARIVTHYAGQGEAMADRLARQQLDELTPEQVFSLCHQRHYGQPPEPELQAAFVQLLSEHQEQAS